MALPGKADLALYRGDTRVWTVTFTDDDGTTPLDLSGRTWVAEIRTDLARTDPVVATITVDDADAADGTLTLTLPADEAANLGPLVDGKATLFWDLQSDDSGVVQTWLAGKVKVTGDVSVGADDVVA